MGRLIPVASTAFRCRDSLRLARPPQQIVAAAFVFRSGTLVVTNSYDVSVISRLALGACDADFRDARKIVTPGLGLSWGPAIAGAIAATALAFVLDSFGVAIGLALSSVSPTWRDTSFALVLLSGLYLVLAALASFGLGGYIAGRMRRRYDPGELPEFQDGMHGLLVWGIATLLVGLIAAIALPLLPRTPGVAAATPNATSSVPGESLILRARPPISGQREAYWRRPNLRPRRSSAYPSHHVEPHRNGSYGSHLPGSADRCRHWNGCTGRRTPR